MLHNIDYLYLLVYNICPNEKVKMKYINPYLNACKHNIDYEIVNVTVSLWGIDIYFAFWM
jgi:hypothetical protein